MAAGVSPGGAKAIPASRAVVMPSEISKISTKAGPVAMFTAGLFSGMLAAWADHESKSRNWALATQRAGYLVTSPLLQALSHSCLRNRIET